MNTTTCNVPQSSLPQVNPAEPSHTLECPVDTIPQYIELGSSASSRASSTGTFFDYLGNIGEFLTLFVQALF